MSLRNARPGEEQELLKLLDSEPLLNSFMIAGLRGGLGNDLEVWVKDGVGILMRRGANWYCDPGPDGRAFPFEAAAAIMDRFPPGSVRGLRGRPESVSPLQSRLTRHRGRLYQQCFCVMDTLPAPTTCPVTARAARPEDLEAIVALNPDDEGSGQRREAVARLLPYTWVMEDGGRIVAVAEITAQTDKAAMIGAFFTAPTERRRGYARGLMHGLTTFLLSQGLTPCAYFHKSESRGLTLGVGFREIAAWHFLRFDPAQ